VWFCLTGRSGCIDAGKMSLQEVRFFYRFCYFKTEYKITNLSLSIRLKLDLRKKEKLIGLTKLVIIERKPAENNDEGAIVSFIWNVFPWIYVLIIIFL